MQYASASGITAFLVQRAAGRTDALIPAARCRQAAILHVLAASLRAIRRHQTAAFTLPLLRRDTILRPKNTPSPVSSSRVSSQRPLASSLTPCPFRQLTTPHLPPTPQSKPSPPRAHDGLRRRAGAGAARTSGYAGHISMYQRRGNDRGNRQLLLPQPGNDFVASGYMQHALGCCIAASPRYQAAIRCLAARQMASSSEIEAHNPAIASFSDGAGESSEQSPARRYALRKHDAQGKAQIVG